MRLSSRADQLRASPTLAIDAKVKELAASGADVVNLGAGEPDFPTPKAVVEAAHAAALEGKTKYTATPGTAELRAAIARRVGSRLGLRVDPSQVVVANGCKQALFDALQALVGPEDEVLVLAPYWVSYPQLVELAGGRMVPVAVDSRTLEPDVGALEAACTPRTRGLVLNSPNNPTGAVYSRACLEGLAAFARERDLWILSDEIYERLVYGGAEHVSPAQVGREGLERTVVASGFSKSYAMTGWRVGYLVASPEVARAAGAVQGHVTSSVNTPAQWAALAALALDESALRPMVEEFAARRTLFVNGLREAFGRIAPVAEPRGAFYLFQDVRPLLGRRHRAAGPISDDGELATALLDHARVAVVPGTAFGAPGWIRFSYATGRDRLRAASDRIRGFLGELI
ncbi:MAG TPA: pyridoxal phosphate-dependent aminotransferase [Planctomycetota bacterium]|nr:pyridoxal phosphate-dependent aminotransferase [Planctomycetota bacterium]